MISASKVRSTCLVASFDRGRGIREDRACRAIGHQRQELREQWEVVRQLRARVREAVEFVERLQAHHGLAAFARLAVEVQRERARAVE
jgi:hypothetical protein